ncbi:opioid growth factor receptor isoform X1 [Conger conger]|uniref:opioid growth factor receptor isoform X1 n=1 Tax=Conger conger TaxID=82655 RepID=UPI002A5AF4FF|nr:opioid growth factor receptor isoform X1 [Conger conger]
MEDDLVCEYDSTWDTESDGDDLGENITRRSSQDKTQKSWGFWSNTSSRNLRAARDMQNYRHGYPNINEEECPEERMTNLKFYLNEIASSPDDVSIEVFHKEWKTDYKRLERVHSYIQWLFPLREPGVNYMASELTKKEIQVFRENDEAKQRLVESYELMLGFYGIQLLNKETGEVKRAENWRERFANLERNMHNNLRITRILKSMGELGFEHYQAPLVRFFLEETLVRKNLSSVKRSVLDYFLFAVRDKRERRKLLKFAYQNYEPKDKFVWCPRKIQKRLRKKSEKKAESAGNGESGVPEEGRLKNKAKDSEAGSAPKENKSTDDSAEMQTLTEVDSQIPLLESSVDRDSVGSTVDPEALGNGETDDSGISEPVPAKTEAEPDDQLKEGSQTEDSTQCQQKLANGKQSEEAMVCSEKPAKKKREEVTLKPCCGSLEGLPNGQGHATAVATAGSPDSSDHKQCDSPKNAATEGAEKISSTAGERPSEKQPRTDPSSTGKNTENVRTEDTTGKDESKDSDVSVQSHVVINLENQEMSAGAGTNGINLKNNEEPMDIESANSIEAAMDQS